MSFCNSSSCFSWITFSFSFSLFWIICAILLSSMNFFVLFCCFSLSRPSFIPRVFKVLSFITSLVLSTDSLACLAFISLISRSCRAVSCFCWANWAATHNFLRVFLRSSKWERIRSRSSRRCLSANRDHWTVCSETSRRTIGSLDSSALLSNRETRKFNAGGKFVVKSKKLFPTVRRKVSNNYLFRISFQKETSDFCSTNNRTELFHG